LTLTGDSGGVSTMCATEVLYSGIWSFSVTRCASTRPNSYRVLGDTGLPKIISAREVETWKLKIDGHESEQVTLLDQESGDLTLQVRTHVET
jgi:hypothetical protein